MKLFAISNRGLAVIGTLVIVLWSLILTEQALTRRAHEDHYEFMRSQPQMSPVETPQPTANPLPDRPTVPVDELSQTGLLPDGRV